MLEFCVLSSGSKANCVYVRSGETRVLIDCGLSAREATKRLSSIGVSVDDIHAVVVSHEHSDHVAGIPVLSRKNKLKFYSNPATFEASRHLQQVKADQFEFFETGTNFAIDEIGFEAFSILHDAADPVAFRVRGGDYCLGVVTDLGQVTNLVRERTRALDAIIIESNHDPLLLQECPYPWELKQRIAGRSGHLSNESAGELLQFVAGADPSRLRVVIAAHISEKSNDPMLALDVLRSSWSKTLLPEPEFIAASAYEPTSVIRF